MRPGHRCFGDMKDPRKCPAAPQEDRHHILPRRAEGGVSVGDLSHRSFIREAAIEGEGADKSSEPISFNLIQPASSDTCRRVLPTPLYSASLRLQAEGQPGHVCDHRGITG
jgi:hypothetical protein